jgi:hypothetical protein
MISAPAMTDGLRLSPPKIKKTEIILKKDGTKSEKPVEAGQAPVQ